MTWAAAGALLRRFWWAVPMIGLLAALHFTRTTLADRTATLRTERAAWTAEIAKAEQLRLDAEKRFASQQAAALTTYADRLAAREPIILRSTETVRTYAQTDAGRAACLPADRVRGIDALDAELFAGDPARSRGGDQALSADLPAPAD
ncbi:hypothetical protein C8J44_2759 [Sphingomonas sp. PP-CE-3A-406]|uniref:hypothetical protein n=1 Tax=Sphingomonas sp. PP-CE-3A-406 TaxID=2135659 RepID=UPI000EF9D606|nr:hypothetical protein [Sphingomonas sp. PP-CE-3A-406]RMB51740.1 hypothetical protein C8J44_2759 [Sphingomonas sp. PP-CE-3A-406]